MIGFRELPYVVSSYAYRHKKMPAEMLLSELNHKMDAGIPFVAGKIGGFELWALRAVEFGYCKEYEAVYDKLCNNAGFFSDTDDIAGNLEKYSEIMKRTLGNVDYLIRWQYPKEEYFVRKYCQKSLTDIDWLGVVYRDEPIGTILQGRKVLVVTPFAEAVERQYSRREKVYEEAFLPQFELKTYKAVQTIAGNRDARYDNWFGALEGMQEQIGKIDFDIALVGCGAYSLPICSYIKGLGRSAIHMGGDVQILFGIMGKRWENNEFIQSKKNDYWIYPDKNDIPSNSDSVEDGCYW